ncbi:MerR family transcriptional regulator [Compostimonas suwonensis]|uniref:DNA-binding transcriptional MerR regulator n=1 Tax=Compostimonas suwonensis TaxID=1048394 RepID=A0A2M9BB72_9MICO|nr:MerR family transcriptional regulator [Compostimonas suwonensis]PJJ55189.1 DNA-binding transcriptional MerR regulator [Compostimonas suwonensis]
MTSAPLTTAAVAAASGYSVQQIRDLERLGVIPPAHRAPNGYRVFTTAHLLAARAYRGLAVAIGPVAARRALRDARGLPFDEAMALISSFHVTLARQRDDALAAQRALRLIQAEARGEETVETGRGDQADDDVMTITELAAALGVRASTLRFWEQSGLVRPERVTAHAARRYPPAAIREARITSALRAAGYRIPEVRGTIRSIRELADLDDLDDLDLPAEALRTRLTTIAERTLALVAAGAEIAELIGVTREQGTSHLP